MSTVVAVGHEKAVEQLITELRRERHYGLEVVAVCLAGASTVSEIAGVPVVGDLDEVRELAQADGHQPAVLSASEWGP